MRFQTDPNDYSENEWAISAGHCPLADRPRHDTLLLHRHWMWANQQREIFDRHAAEASADNLTSMGLAGLATKQFGFMFAWYGMLWSVIEACIDPKEGRNIDIRGRFREDIDHLAPTLRCCRNAILQCSTERSTSRRSDCPACFRNRISPNATAHLPRFRAVVPGGVQSAGGIEAATSMTLLPPLPISLRVKSGSEIGYLITPT
jgi:hypothetical protein